MATVHMNTRRWFWALTVGLTLWMAIAVRWIDTPSRAANFGVGEKLFIPLLPLSRLLTFIQYRIHLVTTSFVGPQGPQKDLAALQAENRRLDNQLYMLTNQYVYMSHRFALLEGERTRHPELKFVTANIAAIDQSASAQLCTLDKGTSSGIHRGAIVQYDYVPVGKVISESPFVSTVRLITDPFRPLRINAQLQRRTPSGIQIIADTCQVHGIANGMLACDNVSAVHTIPPEIGDTLIVRDLEWHAMDGAIIGQVTKVAHLESQPLLYDLNIRPAVDIRSCPFVLVQVAE